jgi:hypothetical protein
MTVILGRNYPPAEPKKPLKEYKIWRDRNITDAEEVVDLVAELKEKGIEPVDIEIAAEGDEDYSHVEARWQEKATMPDEEFDRRMKVYEVDMAEYKIKLKAYYEHQLSELEKK